MPVIKSAKKKLRQDKKRQTGNKIVRDLLKKTLKEARKNISEKNIKEAFSIVDKAAKKNIIHKNKAGRIKSSLSKLIGNKTPKTAAIKKAPTKKKSAKK